MSTSLHVPYNRALFIGDLLQAIETSLASILTLRPRVDVKIGADEEFSAVQPDNFLFSDRSAPVYCQIQNDSATVQLLPVTVPAWNENQEYTFISIAPSRPMTAPGLALTGAAAHALALLQDSSITDNSSTFTNHEVLKPEEFLRLLQVRTEQGDYQSASLAFAVLLNNRWPAISYPPGSYTDSDSH